ncbi:MAG: RecQ family ATP-dependent DNA helicase [Nitrospirota bacterium]|nr:RecQ family ATP-dependent DNA helicase [Nitrospirota bacterium]
MPPEATQCLRERFGFSAFRAGQEDIVAAMLAGRDVLAIMPTGGGKSLCYQLPACISEGVTLVVSPLIALMKDQVDALAARGIPAAAVNSSLSFEQVRQIMDQVKSGHTRLLYVAPERFGSRWFMAAMSGVKVARVAVDEAHCISQWGHDFRPAYMAIGEAVVRLGRPPVAALTATATPQVQDDIGEKLGLVSPFRTVTGFDRRNLFLEVREGGKKKDALGEFLNTQPGPGIIYCATRKHVEEVAAALSAGGAKHGGVTAYHAGMPDPQRTQAQEAFIGGNTGIIVATNAFGMGVDKADVRFVLHYDMPGTLEAYYQEAGRAGRDGKPARCTVLFGGGDRFTQEFFINGTYPTAEFVRQVWQALSRNAEDGVTELSNRDLLAMVSEEGSEFAVSAALKLLEQAGGIQRLNPRSNPALIRVLNRSRISGRATVQLQILAALDFHLPADDRNGAVEISPLDLAHDANLDPDALMRGLHAMHEAGAIAYTPPFRGRGVRLMSTGVPPVDFDAVENKRAWALGCLDSMEAYCRSGGCRRAAILAHFGETLSEPCGACDRCRDGGATLPVEATELARKVLSGVARCRRGSVSFGAQTVAAHLTGGNTDTVRRYGLDKASTYGLLRDLGQKQVVDLLEQLTAQGLLKRQDAGGEGSGGRRPVLVMTEAGLSVLKGERGDVRLRLPTAESPAPAARRAGVGGGPGREMVRETSGETFRETVREAGRAEADLYVAHADPELLALLKGVRNRTAREEGIAAYLVFADRTLAEMAVLRPADRAAMLAVNGVGERKFERFGAIFLRAIRDHA